MRMPPLALGITLLISISRVALAQPGKIVVTDLDDTIKATHVGDPIAMVFNGVFGRTTFSGMPELFQAWKAQNETSAIYYLSGGPKSMRGLVRDFLEDRKFPEGALLLRSIFKESDQARYKLDRLEKIAKSSEGNFVLLGDDTEHDPEVYAQFLANHPDRVLAIYIHRVNGRALPDSSERPFFTSLDIAAWELQDGRLSPEEVQTVAQGALSSNPDAVLIPTYGLCPDESPEGDPAPLLAAPMLRMFQKLIEQDIRVACEAR